MTRTFLPETDHRGPFAVEPGPELTYKNPMLLHGHAKADRRHWYLHQVALEKLRLHPELLPPVLALLDRWLA